MGNNKQHVVVVVVVRHVVHPEYEYISAITLEARMDHRKLKVQGVAGFWHERWWALTMTDVAKGRQLLGQAAQRSLTWQPRRVVQLGWRDLFWAPFCPCSYQRRLGRLQYLITLHYEPVNEGFSLGESRVCSSFRASLSKLNSIWEMRNFLKTALPCDQLGNVRYEAATDGIHTVEGYV